MLSIRLQRVGRTKAPSYRLVLSENARDTQGRATEILGHYNPVVQPKVVSLKVDRIKHWLSQGAQASGAVHNLLVREGVISDEKKKKAVRISNKRQKKIDDKNAAEVEAKRQAEEAAKAAKESEEQAAREAAEAAKAAEAAANEAPAEAAPAESTEASSEGGEEPKAEEAPAEEEKKAE